MDYEVFLREFYRLERFGIKLGLDVITDLLRRLGDPHDRFPAVHVTGTNGKGSVCAYLASILRAAGFRVGLYTSPHLVRFNERIRVNGEMIGDQDVMRLYGEIQPHMEAMAARNPVHHATFFEVTTAMAFQYFAEQEVDIAVIEVGMGGRYDATNVIDPEVSVITRVGLEHTEHLGRTVRRIAREKAGIIKNGKPAVTVEQEALPEIEARCRITGSPLAVVGRDVRFERVRFDLGGQTIRVENGGSREIEVSLLGRFQGEN
ncbi:MAG TPA: Mur ligase family protein, partial [Thermoplasmata archaeon]|nr:Mur ligase family protein [Thermoplasmata archaeon]